VNYPLDMFFNIAKLKLQTAGNFKNKPTWSNNSWEKSVHPTVYDFDVSDHPNNVKIGDEIEVTVHFCPRVRIEGFYFVTIGKNHTLVEHKQDNIESIVETSDHWIDIARKHLPSNQIGCISVTIKYRLIKNISNSWEAIATSEPSFRFTIFEEKS